VAKKLVKKTPAGKSAPKSPAPKVAAAKPAPATKRPSPAAKSVPVMAKAAKPVAKVLTASKPTKAVVTKAVVAKPSLAAKTVAGKLATPKIIARPQVGPTLSIGSAAVKLTPGSKPVLKLVKVARPKPEPIPVRLPPAPVRSDSKMARNKAGISPKELEYFRGLLLEKRREITGDVSSMETTALRSGNGNLSSLPMHMADNGTDNYEQEFTLGLVQKDRELLRDINVALAKIQDGSYGICEGTGKPIAKPRLEAQPWAKYSIEHARALERPQFRRAF
jgi:RNA polymerase-binding protein DksA